MPTPDMSDPGAANQDWLNQFLTWMSGGGQGAPPGALPNPGASTPYGPRSQVWPPGAKIPGNQMPWTSPGAPSMGYPAAQSPFPPGAQPATAPDPTAVLRAGGTPVPGALAGGGGPGNSPAGVAGVGAPVPFPPPRPVPTAVGAYPGSTSYPQYGSPAAPAIGAPPPVGNDQGTPNLGGGVTQAALPTGAPGSAAAVPLPSRRPANLGAAIPPTARAQVPNLGYYNPRFDLLPGGYNVSGGGRTPYISALNLGSLFGGRGNTAVNPNVPAPAAQPVSSSSAPPMTTNAPWGYGPLQKGRGWPQGPDWNDIYAARSRSGYQ